MLRLLTSLLVVLLFSTVSLAQKAVHGCEVVAVDVTGTPVSQMASARTTELGTFEPVIGEEELTTKIYRLPKTRLFVVASVWYTDESLASTKGADSISLQLMVSKTRKRDVLRSVVYANAEFPLNAFDVGRVTTLLKASGRSWFLMIECRTHKPANG